MLGRMPPPNPDARHTHPPPAAWSDATTRWRTYDPMEWRLTAGISERMLDLAAVAPGMAVLDLGCGSGDTTLLAARRVGPTGQVVGLDVSASMLELAAEKLARPDHDAAGRAPVTLTCADAATMTPPDRPYDAVLARWSLMYMTAPDEAVRRAAAALGTGGVFVAAVWAEPERVEFASLWRRVLARHREVPQSTNPSSVFRFADGAALAPLIEAAGLVIEREEEHRVPVAEFATGADYVTWLLNFGGEPNRLIAELPAAVQAAVLADLAEAAESFRQGPVILIGGVTRIVVARPGS